ncbi:MAG: DNA polymerase [Acetobacter sp.]|nr:DNA polymerase [Acetobacter sp.]
MRKQEQQPAVSGDKQAGAAPIKADLSQVKPKRKASSKSKQEKVIVDTTAELRSTIDRIFADEDAILITTQAELIEFLRQQEVFGLDTETTGLKFYKDKIAGFSLGTATRSAYIPLQHTVGQNYQDDIEIMCEILLERKYYGFNAKFDWHFLEAFRPQLRNLELAGEGSIALRCYDINIPHQLKPAYKAVIDPNYEEYSFTKLFGGRPFNEFDPKDVYKYAAVDARKHYVITEYFENKLRELPEIYERYRRIELRVLKPVYETEKYGFCLDSALVQKLYDELEEKKVPALARIQELAGNPTFNPSSPKQVKEVFAKFGYNLSSTNEEALEKIPHPLAKAILEYRGIVKLQGTYTTNLFDFTSMEGENRIIHPDFNTIGADTSRMSSKDPNLQNIPRDNKYRNMLIARPGHKLVSVDFSQQEVRIIAAMAGDEVMLDAFRSGKDFYAMMASIVFNLPYEECGKHGVNGAKRNQMKSVVLGLNYSMGVKSLAADLTADAIQTLSKKLGRQLTAQEEASCLITESAAQAIVDAFYRVCPKIHTFQKYCLDFAKSHGYNETFFKHRRYYKGLGYQALGLPRFDIFGPGLKNAGITAEEVMQKLYDFKNNRSRLKEFIAELEKPGKKKETKHLAIYVRDRESTAFAEERQCTNSVVQGTGAEMTKLAAIVVQDDKEMKRLGAHIVNYIHDEIMIEAPDETAQAAGDRLAFIMNDVCNDMLGVAGGAEPEIMVCWTKS